jgi:hypothetical protein
LASIAPAFLRCAVQLRSTFHRPASKLRGQFRHSRLARVVRQRSPARCGARASKASRPCRQFEQAIAASLRLSVLLVRSRVPGFFVACCILTIRSSGPRTARCAKLAALRPRPLTSGVRPQKPPSVQGNSERASRLRFVAAPFTPFKFPLACFRGCKGGFGFRGSRVVASALLRVTSRELEDLSRQSLGSRRPSPFPFVCRVRRGASSFWFTSRRAAS